MGSSMKFMLYFIYDGFFLGTFSLENFVADITTQSTSLSTVISSNSSRAVEAFASRDITKILPDYLQSARGILTSSFILSALGMISIAGVCIKSRDNKIKKIDRLIKENRPVGDTQLDEHEILRLEEQILGLFPFRT
jgi:hypothetical protein